MHPQQSNIQNGPKVFGAATNLLAAIAAGTNVGGTLVKMAAGSKVEIPNAATDVALFVVEDVQNVTSTSADVSCRPLEGGVLGAENVRLQATGTGNAGDPLTHDTAAYGQVKKWTSGSAWIVGYAEENWVAGQFVLIRSNPHTTAIAAGIFTAQSTPAITEDDADVTTEQGLIAVLAVSNPPTQAQVTAIRDHLATVTTMLANVAIDLEALSDAVKASGLFT